MAPGAIVLGKTAVTEFGYSGASHSPVGETTRNPWNLERTSGGSSAGSGAAVAAGMGPVAIAADGGGSIRIPASFCGLFGMKASMGRVPMYPSCRDERYPGIASWEGLEHVGPVSRTVADSALVLSVIAGPDPRDRHSIPAGDVDWLRGRRGPATCAACASPSAPTSAGRGRPRGRAGRGEAAGAFADLGCEVEAADPSFPDPGAAFAALIALESDLRGMRELVDRHGHEMSPHLVDLITRQWRAEEFTDAQTTRKAVVNAMWRFMRHYDLLADADAHDARRSRSTCRARSASAAATCRDTAWLSFTYPFNLTGQPAATVPAGFTGDGLPVGLQIVGGHLADGLVLRAAAAFEAARPWAQHRPPLADGSRRDARGFLRGAGRSSRSRRSSLLAACGGRAGPGAAGAGRRRPPTRARSSAPPPRATPPRSAACSPPAPTSTGAPPTAAPPSRRPRWATTSRPRACSSTRAPTSTSRTPTATTRCSCAARPAASRCSARSCARSPT